MATAKIIIKGEDQLKGPLNQAQQELAGFESVANKVGDTLKKAFTVAAIVKGIQEISKAVAACVNEFKEQVEVETRLDSVIKATGQQYKYTTKDIKDYASSLQSVTRFGDDVIESSAQLLVATQKFSKEGLERTLELSADLAEAMGTDLTSATSTLSKALIEPGEGLNRLKTIGVSFTDAEEDMIKALREAGDELGAQQAILDKVEAAYGGVAKSVGSLDTSKLDQIKNVWGDLKEDIGKGFVTLFGGVFDWIYKTLSALQRWTNQIVEKQNFNNYMHSGDVQGLSENFTEEFLQKELDKVSAEYNSAIIELSTEYVSYFNKLWSQEQISIGDFIRLSYEDQTEALNKILGPGQEGIMLAIRDIADGTYQYLLLQDAIKKQQDDIFKAEQFAMAKQAEETASAAANAAQSALDAALNKYGNLSETFKIQELDDNIAQIVKLLEREDLGAFNRSVLEEALLSLQTQRAAYNPLDLTPNPVDTGIHFNVRGIDPLGLNNPFNMNPLNAITAGASTGFGEFWTNLDTALGNYGSKSVSLQASMLEEEIGKISALLDSSFLDENSPTFTYLTEIRDSLNDELEAVLKGNEQQKTFIEKLGDSFGEFISKTFNVGSEEGGAAAGALIGTAVSKMGEAGEVVSRLAQNMATMGPALGAIVTALQYVIEGLMEGLGDILNTFVQFGIGPLREFGRILADALIPLFEAIMPSVEDSANMLIEVFSLIGKVLKPIITTIGNVLGPILSKITQFLEKVVLPIIQMVANVFIGIATVIEWVGQWIGHLIASVINWAGGWLGIHVNDPGEPDRLDVMLSDRLATVGEYNNSGLTGSDADTASAVQNASYSGGTTVYLNVFNYGNVIGENGMDEFALIIRDKLYETNYFGK